MGVFKLSIPLVLSFLLTTNVYAQTKPATADEVVKAAKMEAAKSNRNVFVIFHASWCVWCHRMDTAMNDTTIQSFFEKNYVIKHLTVDERGDKKILENPGAMALLTKYNGDQQGIPYWFILDKNGKLLADSRIHSESGELAGNNVGCPAQPGEVAYFIRVLKNTSSPSDRQLELIQKRFLQIGN